MNTMFARKLILSFLLALVCALGCMKLLAGPKVYASAHPQQKLTLSLPNSDDQAGDSDDSLFDVSDGEDFALLPRAPELVLYPVMRVFTTRADLPTHFQLAVELPPPKV